MSVAVTGTNQTVDIDRCKDSPHAETSIDAAPNRHQIPGMHGAPRSV